MPVASFVIDPAFTVAPVRRRTFGSFVEHMGRCVYTGIFEPEHPRADEDGFRTDVLELVREMGVTVVRYPGGNFVSGYRWEDGVGPVDQRPTRLDDAWHSLEPNTFGLGEFATWAAKAGIEPMLAINLGTRGLAEALDLQEYCNHPGGTALSDLRRAHGHPDPFDVRMWCLGNEMDGPWQMGHKTAAEYGRIAAEVARGMRRIDPDLELVACGSSHSAMPTFGAWEAEVLEQAYEHVDFISAHAYYQERDGDLASFLASADNMEAFIDDVVATADHVRAKVRARKRIDVSFDEWNVWYQSDLESQLPPGDEWPVAPRLGEDTYTAADAVVVGSLLITLLRHSDRVTAACQAQLVNTIAPIHAEPGGDAFRKTSFYPFAHASQFAAGDVLRVEVRSPSFANESFGESAAVHAVATHDADSGELVVFVVNRHPEETVQLSIGTRAFPQHRVVEHLVLHDDDPHAANTTDDTERVTPRRVEGAQATDGEVRVDLAPVSWNVLRLQPGA